MDKKIKILSVVEGTGWCGTKEQTYLISKNLSKYFDVHVAIAFNYELMVKKFLQDDSKVKVKFFHDEKKFKYGIFNITNLRKIILSEKYDVIIPHSSNSLNMVLLATLFTKNKPKIIALKRSDFEPNFISQKFKYGKADKIVVTSSYLEDRFKRLWGNKLISINSGIELSRFLKKDESLRKSYRKKLNLDYDDKVFINVANWQPWRKGQDLILKSFANLDCNKCKLLFVGNDTDSKEVKKLINDYGLEGRVLGLGFREDVENLLNASDFFVFASYNETLAAAVVQAMASGKVVISTLAGGIGEYLKDGYNGFTVKVGDQKELEEKMRKALNISEEEYNLISSRAVNTAKKYSIEETTKKWVNLINNLVNS